MEMGVSASQFFILNLFRGTRFEMRTAFTPILFPDVFQGFVSDSLCFNCRDMRKQRPRIRINLTIALTLAQVAFLAGIDRSEHLVSHDDGGR